MRDRRAIYNHVCHASDSFLGLNFAIYTWDVMVLLEAAVFRFLFRLIFIFFTFLTTCIVLFLNITAVLYEERSGFLE